MDCPRAVPCCAVRFMSAICLGKGLLSGKHLPCQVVSIQSFLLRQTVSHQSNGQLMDRRRDFHFDARHDCVGRSCRPQRVWNLPEIAMTLHQQQEHVYFKSDFILRHR